MKAKAKDLAPSTMEKYTTISDLEKSNKGRVWAMNNLSQAGMVLIGVPKRNGNGQDVAKIPHTFIPIDLTMQVNKAQLLDSSDFRKAVQSKLIRLVTDEYAAKILSSAEGKKEEQIVAQNMSRAKLAIESEILNGGKGLVKEDDEDNEVEADEDSDVSERNLTEKQKKVKAATAQNKSDRKETDPSIDIRFRKLIANAVTEKMSQIEIVAMLKRRKGLTLPEIKYAQRYFRDFPKVARFLLEAKEKAK